MWRMYIFQIDKMTVSVLFSFSIWIRNKKMKKMKPLLTSACSRCDGWRIGMILQCSTIGARATTVDVLV
jgi:hypothetical protein